MTGKRSTLTVLLYFVLVLVNASPVWGAGAVGLHSGQFLRLGAGARGPAMANALTALSSEADAFRYNPASLAESEGLSVSMSQQQRVAGIKLTEGTINHPLTHQYGWGMTIRTLDYGTTDRTRISMNSGSVTGIEDGTFNGRDLTSGIGLGGPVGLYSLNWGMLLRYTSMNIDSVTAGGPSLDVGLKGNLTPLDLITGLTVQHIGPDVKFDKRLKSLPTLIRLGVAKDFFYRSLWLEADVEKINKRNTEWMLGSEWHPPELEGNLSFRAGYENRNDINDGLTIGLGLTTDTVQFNYAFSPMREFGNEHRYSFTWIP